MNLQDRLGNTPLHISSNHGFSNISQLLIDSGCNKNLKNWEGRTPLDLEPFPYFLPFPPYPGDSEEAKGTEGYVYASQKELISSEEPEPAVSRKLKRTKGRTSRVERGSTNRTRCEVM